MDPDILAIQEGPSTTARMVLFVTTFLSDSFVVFGDTERKAGEKSSQQQIFILAKKDRFSKVEVIFASI
jgi:hypothetical protein